MKIIFSGDQYFSQNLTTLFSKIDKKNKYLYLNIKTDIFNRVKFYLHLLTTDVLFVNYVDAHYMKSVNFALFLKKKVVLSWIGTDVMDAVPRIEQGLFNKNYIEKTFHTTNSTWLQEELNDINIKAKYLTIFIYEDKLRVIDIPNKFSVLTYISKGRESFYGIDTIIKLANELNHIEFNIAGISSYPNLPSNINPLGWVDMDKELEKCTVFIRYPHHDGESHSVLEALSYGKVVCYNRDYPFVNYTPNYNTLKQGIEDTLLKYNNKTLKPNYKAIEHIKVNYSLDKVYKEYISLFNTIVKDDM